MDRPPLKRDQTEIFIHIERRVAGALRLVDARSDLQIELRISHAKRIRTRR
jgi:hypothetical protein